MDEPGTSPIDVEIFAAPNLALTLMKDVTKPDKVDHFAVIPATLRTGSGRCGAGTRKTGDDGRGS